MDRSKQLGEKKIPQLLFSFSLPAIVGMTVQASYSVIDGIFVGKGIGELGLAGITIGYPLIMIMFAFYVLIGVGSGALISIRLGEGKKEEARRIVGNGFAAVVTLCAILTIAGLACLNPLLVKSGASPKVLPYARDFMQIMLFSNVIAGIGFSGNNFIRAEGDPKTALWTMLIGAGTNALLAPLFIFVFHWGMKGAALATAGAQTVSAIWVLTYFISGKSQLRPTLADLKPRLAIVKRTCAIGSSSFAMNVAGCGVMIVINNMLKAYGGDTAISAMGIVMRVQMLVMMPIFGIHQGAQPIIGYNHGAGNPRRVRSTLKLSAAAASAVALVGFLACRLMPTTIVGMFSNDPALTLLGSHALVIFFTCMPLVGLQVIGACYFQAVGRPLEAMLLGLSRQVILLIPAAIILPRFFGLNGVFAAGPFSDGLAAMLTAGWLWMELKRLDPINTPATT